MKESLYNSSKINKLKYSFLTVYLLFSFLPTLLLAQISPQGFFLESWFPKTIAIADFDTVLQTNQHPDVSVSINADSILTKVSKFVYGHNAAAWGGKLEQSTLLVNSVKNLSPNVIRWPGGSMSDDYFWNASDQATCPTDLPPTYVYGDLAYGANNTSWTMSTDSYYSLLAKTKSTGIICVNYAYARLGTGSDPVMAAAILAADWVRYDNGRTKFWEIGNENFGSWEKGFEIDTKLNKDGQPKTISGDLYGKHCKVFINEMRKAAQEVGNDIKIGVVAMDGNVTWDVVQRDWNKGMMKQIANDADFLIVHSYYTSYQENSSVATILNSAANTKNYKNYVTEGLKTNANHAPLPVALTEWNIFAEGSGQAVSYINGLHATLILGELIRNNYGQGSRWDFMNGWNNGDCHGLFADGEPGIPRYTPRAPFFYMYYFQKFFGDKMIQSSVTGSNNILCYASRFSSGQCGIVLTNKGNTEQVVNFDIRNFRSGDRYYYYLLTGGTDNGDFSRKVFVNNKSTISAGGGPSDYASIKPYGSFITDSIKITIPKLAALFLLIENDSTLTDQSIIFDSLPAMVIGDPDSSITAVASSGLLVQFASDDPGVATIKDRKIHIVGTGTCNIFAYQDGDTIYRPANQEIQTLVISKGTQSITMDTITKVVFSDADFAINAISSSGLTLQFEIENPEVAVIRNGMIHIVGVGTSVITASQNGNKNFIQASPVIGTLTVSKAEQTITFPGIPAKTEGDPDFSPEAVTNSGLICTYISSNQDVATISNNQIHIVSTGTTVITAQQEGNKNFNAAPEVSQELIVTEKSSMGVGSDLIEFTMFPNLASDYLTIKLNNLNQVLTIYNAIGIQVYSCRNTSRELNIPLIQIGGNGIYFIKVNSKIKKFSILK
jgi:hypothetical protein